jgi:predicted dinucleotide-binding enzyme
VTIDIIGADHLGGALAQRFRAVGHDVAIAYSRGPQLLAQLASAS